MAEYERARNSRRQDTIFPEGAERHATTVIGIKRLQSPTRDEVYASIKYSSCALALRR